MWVVKKSLFHLDLNVKRKCLAKNDRTTTCYWYSIYLRWWIHALKSNIPALQLLWICLHFDDSEFCSLKACLKWTTQASDIFYIFISVFWAFSVTAETDVSLFVFVFVGMHACLLVHFQLVQWHPFSFNTKEDTKWVQLRYITFQEYSVFPE